VTTPVTLFRTCVADVFSPDTVAATTRVLEASGCAVSCPAGQTCCGQPAWNAGFVGEAARVARTSLAALDTEPGASHRDAPVVVPAGSCATMITHYWPELFRLVGDTEAERRARLVAGRTHELTRFLTEQGLPELRAGAPVAVALHQSCHSLRELGSAAATREAVAAIEGCAVAPWPDADAQRCCGFGGTFSLKLPETAEAMAEEKLASLRGLGADCVTGTDLSCLLHLRARSEAVGTPVEIRHVADLLDAALGSEGAGARRATGHERMTATAVPEPAASPAEPGPSDRSAAVEGPTLRSRTATAVADPVLRSRLRTAVDRFAGHRAEGLAELADANALRRAARAIKGELLADLPAVLDDFADSVLALGGHVHWAADAAAADDTISTIVRAAAEGRPDGALVVKSKSMATEEIGLNRALEAAGCQVVETDLGEWIVQLAGERPSHIIAPAVHHDRHSIRATFLAAAGARPDEVPAVPEGLNAYARGWLRDRFLRADVGITGANFAVAESGSIVLVTNEGNGRMVTSLPRVHVVVLGMERVVRDWDQLDLLLTLLTRSATGQRLTSYTSVVTGPRRHGEPDGPEELHVVILDNGRSDLLGGEFHEMLACIRCGACLNACPVYRQVGGHAYGGVYAGPMGAVLTPLLEHERPGAAETADASTLCGACMQACPVEIPLQDLLLSLRRRNAPSSTLVTRLAWRAWAQAWGNPVAYRGSVRLAAAGRALVGPADRLRRRGGHAAGRTLPVPPPRPKRGQA
jgi:L-lactate dehydrogenase complex protein LldF